MSRRWFNLCRLYLNSHMFRNDMSVVRATCALENQSFDTLIRRFAGVCVAEGSESRVVARGRQHEELDVTEMGAEFGEQ